MQEVFRIVRRQGVRMTFMIDDQCNWASTEGQAKAQVRLLPYHDPLAKLAAAGCYSGWVTPLLPMPSSS